MFVGVCDQSPSSERVTRSGSLKSPTFASQQLSTAQAKPGGGAKRGRKRKSAVDSNTDFDISHFMDGQVSACICVC